MAIWESWFGSQTSTDTIDQFDEQSDNYVKILNAQYQVANSQIQQNLYNGLAHQVTGVNLPATQYWNTNTPPHQVQTTGGIVTQTIPMSYPNMSTVWASTSVYPSVGMYQPTVQAGVSNPAPEIGDKMVMEWDGSSWNTTYIHATPGVMPKKEGIEYSLDEIEEAADLIKDLSEKRLEREAA